MTTSFTVFGASGFVGGRIANKLRSMGHNVSTPSREEIENLDFSKGLGRVVYAIGLTADFRQRPYDTMYAHVSLINNILTNDRFESLIYLSSTRVYKGLDSTEEARSLQVNPNDPDDIYNISKLAGEAVCFSHGGLGTKIVRLSNIVGPTEYCRQTFLGQICNSAREQKHVALRSSLNTEKDYIWIDDAVSSVIRIMQSGKHKIYNVGRGKQTSHREWMQVISDSTGCEMSVEPNAPNGSFPKIDVTRLQDEYSFDFIDPITQIGRMLNANVTETSGIDP